MMHTNLFHVKKRHRLQLCVVHADRAIATAADDECALYSCCDGSNTTEVVVLEFIHDVSVREYVDGSGRCACRDPHSSVGVERRGAK